MGIYYHPHISRANPKVKRGWKVLGQISSGMCHALHHQPGVAYEPQISHLRGMTKAQEEVREELPE